VWSLPSLARVRFCWDTRVDGAIVGHNCTSNGSTINVFAPSDGHVVVSLTAFDAASNRGNPVDVSWTVDTTPPRTNATIISPTVYVPALHANAINTSFVMVEVSASEPVQEYIVTLVRVGAVGPSNSNLSWILSPNDSRLSVPNVLQGDVKVVVSSVDLVGNVDPSPVELAIVSVSMSPTTVFVTEPPALTRATSVAFTVSSPNEVVGLLFGFYAVLTRIDTGTSTEPLLIGTAAASAANATALEQRVVLSQLTSGRYDVQVWAVDVLGNAGPKVLSRMVVDQVRAYLHVHWCAGSSREVLC
jgi:hypothetical protein